MHNDSYLTQGGQSIVFDSAVEPSKDDGDRPEKHVDGVSNKVSDELDEL